MIVLKVLSFAKKNKVVVLFLIVIFFYIVNDLYRSLIFKVKVVERDKRLEEV